MILRAVGDFIDTYVGPELKKIVTGTAKKENHKEAML